MYLYKNGYVVLQKKELQFMDDEEVVRMAQKDIDSYRSKCVWICPFCGDSVSYLDSIRKKNIVYMHEKRCDNLILDKKNHFIKCNHKMNLKREDNANLESKYFDEIFSRYNKMLINKSNFFDIYSDVFDDIYSALCFAFFKAVALFDRNGDMIKTSNRWFKTFLLISVKNKMVDIRKTSSYSKRAPSVTCACCKKQIGQITVKHLLEPGHEKILNFILFNIGDSSIEESGEKRYYYKQIDLLKKRSMYVGRSVWEKMTAGEKRKVFKSGALSAYYMLHPKAFFKNSILSTNIKINEDSDIDMESQQSYSVLSNTSEIDKILDKMNIRNAVDIIMSCVFNKEKSFSLLDSFFDHKCKYRRKLEIIRAIIEEKISYLNSKNCDIDKTYSEVLSGLTATIFKIIRNDRECKKKITKMCL